MKPQGEYRTGMTGYRGCFSGLVGSLCAAMLAGQAGAQALSLDVEAVRVANVGAAWQTIDFVNSYSSAVMACTYNLPSSSDPAATVRLRNVGASSFDVRIQQFENSSVVTASDVHCLIVDAGVHTLPGGLEIEAELVESDGTAGKGPGWTAALSEDISSTRGHTYTSMVVLGQVMTFNDANATAFWTHNCSSRSTPPTPTAFCVGKQVAEASSTRADETLGVITVDAATGSVNDVDYAFARGGDSIRGVTNSPPYPYSVSGDFDTGVASLVAMDGGNGGWAVLYGSDPLPNNSIQLAIEEDTVADTERTHVDEQVDYGVFRNNQSANIAASKSVSVFSGSPTAYAIPGSDVIYTFSVDSTGSAPLDPDTVFLVDTLPDETVFYNGDVDGGGPETARIAFDPKDSGLTFDAVADVGFSRAVAKPTDMLGCGESPTGLLDPTIRHVCFAPKGRMRAGTLQPDTDFVLEFRARIN